MSFPELLIEWKVSRILCLNLCIRIWRRPSPNSVINLFPIGLWQWKMEFEDGLINFKILFWKAEKVSKFLILKFSYSIQWQLIKKNFQIILFGTYVGNVLISSCIICLANARKYFEKILWRLTFKYFGKGATFLYHRLLRIDSKPCFW